MGLNAGESGANPDLSRNRCSALHGAESEDLPPRKCWVPCAPSRPFPAGLRDTPLEAWLMSSQAFLRRLPDLSREWPSLTQTRGTHAPPHGGSHAREGLLTITLGCVVAAAVFKYTAHTHQGPYSRWDLVGAIGSGVGGGNALGLAAQRKS